MIMRIGSRYHRLAFATVAIFGLLATAAAVGIPNGAAAVTSPTPFASARRAGQRLVVIAMDNTHLQDVEQMPALMAEIHHGTLLANDHTGLIAYTHPDYTTVGSGDYPSRTGIESNYQYDGSTGVSFSYWKDTLPDGKPTHVGAPPWKAWTDAGASVGAVGWADWEFENSSDVSIR